MTAGFAQPAAAKQARYRRKKSKAQINTDCFNGINSFQKGTSSSH